MRKQKMIRWIAWAVAGIACVAGGIHVYQKYQEREAAIRAIEAPSLSFHSSTET